MSATKTAAKQDALQQVNELYQQHQSWLNSWLRNKLGCSHRAADLVQDTFLRVLERDEPVEIKEPKAFLSTIARRVLSNHWRRDKIEKAYLDALMGLPETVTPSEEERAILIETVVEIDLLLDGLPLIVKKTFLYVQLEGMRHAEVAEKLSISVTTVKRYLTRAAAQCYFSLDIGE
ncbi:MAG: RNA polymerase subunit sigma [Gammaproteobacteria bacterium]|nr:MAG: RNA polymerase subunit sigma [Gammaproteobacteria bacterium]